MMPTYKLALLTAVLLGGLPALRGAKPFTPEPGSEDGSVVQPELTRQTNRVNAADDVRTSRADGQISTVYTVAYSPVVNGSRRGAAHFNEKVQVEFQVLTGRLAPFCFKVDGIGTPLPGLGSGTPAVWNDRIFVTSDSLQHPAAGARCPRRHSLAMEKLLEFLSQSGFRALSSSPFVAYFSSGNVSFEFLDLA